MRAAHALDLFHPPRLQRTGAMLGARRPVPQAGPAPVLATVPPLGRGRPRNPHLGRNMGDQHTKSDAHHQTPSPFDGQRRIRAGHSSGPLNQDTEFDTPHPARGRHPTTTTSHPTTPSHRRAAPQSRHCANSPPPQGSRTTLPQSPPSASALVAVAMEWERTNGFAATLGAVRVLNRELKGSVRCRGLRGRQSVDSA